jgi:hypothetical protein
VLSLPTRCLTNNAGAETGMVSIRTGARRADYGDVTDI